MRFPLILALALGGLTTTAFAQSGPAELPPASFEGAAYVDSRGCVFSRATIGGSTRWVPRTGLNRAPVCGETPTLADAPAPLAAAPLEAAGDDALAPPVGPTAAPELVDDPVIAAAPAPARPRDVVLPPPPVATAEVPSRPVRATAPRAAVSASRAAAPVRARTVPTGELRVLSRRAAAAARLSGRVTARVIEGEQYAARVAVPEGASRVPAHVPSPLRTASVREQGLAHVPRPTRASVCGDPHRAPGYTCGPVHVSHSGREAGLHVDRRARALRAAAALSADPAPVLSTRDGAGVVTVPAASTTFDYAEPPHGWRHAWDDGRLNPLRGPQTLRGDYQSQAIWTNDVPRQLRRIVRVGTRTVVLPKH
ncbi:hypothetical protein JQC91_11640 [Jannaschia sp. Os4]|uniref:hypothetical protein n=1 Tax=Jannaschia sp. Os4 TaxID=2807617 RepID=UPI00193AC88C|nr:hypothetical protein [Jannaschia sp. Os4]MBM2576951.1 hypothetical protein [Jannaschia sp. Os4]